ncbi:MAG: hypothetical protein ABIH00_03510 [Armatimonadota bacterium]
MINLIKNSFSNYNSYLKESGAKKEENKEVSTHYTLDYGIDASLKINYKPSGVRIINFSMNCRTNINTPESDWDYEYKFREYPDGKLEFVDANLYTYYPSYHEENSITGSGFKNILLNNIQKINAEKEKDYETRKKIKVIYDGTYLLD